MRPCSDSRSLKTEYLNPEEGDEDDEDSDMEIGGMTVNLRCPLLQRYLEEPMTSYVLCQTTPRPADVFGCVILTVFVTAGRSAGTLILEWLLRII